MNDFRNDRKIMMMFGFIVLWIVSAIGSLLVLAALGYVAWHFISKIW